MTATPLPACTCTVKPASGRPHEPSCPVTPLRDAAIARAAEIFARITIPARSKD